MTEIFIAVTRRDLRWARICLASVRRFHPDVSVGFLPGTTVPDGFVRETAR